MKVMLANQFIIGKIGISDNIKNRNGTEFVQMTREPFLIKHLKLKSGVTEL